MAQFDSLIIFTLIWSLLFVLFCYYYMTIKILIPDFFGAKKFREKRLNFVEFFNFFKKNTLIKNNNLYNNVF